MGAADDVAAGQGHSSPSVFSISGYRAFPFGDGANWNTASVAAFTNLLAAGAHFVAVSANDDLPAGVKMTAFDLYFSSAGLPTRHDIGNSHYTSWTNTTGTYYLDVSGDFAPENCALILSFLAGRTINNQFAADGTYNTFIQLKGWQAGSRRHDIDYDTYKQTLWNISTFGAWTFLYRVRLLNGLPIAECEWSIIGPAVPAHSGRSGRFDAYPLT